MKKLYNVMWEERCGIVVEATNKEDAIKKVEEGYGSDISSEITMQHEAYEVSNKHVERKI